MAHDTKTACAKEETNVKKQDDTSPSTRSAEAVFNIPELLEHIIAELPMEQIFWKAQRVSRGWKDAIAASPTIQTKLFLRAQNNAVISPTRHVTRDSSPDNIFAVEGTPVYIQDIQINPLVRANRRKQAKAWCPFGVDFEVLYGKKYLFPYTSSIEGHEILKASPQEDPRESWVDMFLTQPPVTEVMPFDCYHPGAFSEEDLHELVVESSRGLTIGMLRAKTDDLMRKTFASATVPSNTLMENDGETGLRPLTHFWVCEEAPCAIFQSSNLNPDSSPEKDSGEDGTGYH
ncbi:hypothetical protein Q7P37_008596 [Cladosporium fusiforme]